MNELKAIETVYNGYMFRSRLEARWALFFDQIGVLWEYESEGYHTPTGLYVPDFWLPGVYMRAKRVKGVLFEVKPTTHDTLHRELEYVANQLKVSGMLARGFNPNDKVDTKEDYSYCFTEIAPDWDTPMHLLKCRHCGLTRFDYPEYDFDECEQCGKVTYDDSLIVNAFKSSLAYRFW